MQPGIDVICVNYRSPLDLRDFVKSFYECQVEVEFCTLHIVHVAPLEADLEETYDLIHQAQDEVKVRIHADNVGYARACNAAAAQGDRQVIALFNADTILRAGVLRRCYDVITDLWYPERAIAGPRQVDLDGRLTHAGIVGTNEQPQIRGWMQPSNGQHTDLDDTVPTVSGSAYFIRRDVWEELTACSHYQEMAPGALGAFLPTQHYYEETFCSYHATAHDYRCVYVGTETMVHKWHKASPVGGDADGQMLASREYFRKACDRHGILHD